MNKFILTTAINIITLYLISCLTPAVKISSPSIAILTGILLSVLYITVRPILMIICLPVNLITLGLFIVIINAWMLKLTDLMIGGLQVQGFWTAAGVALVIMVVQLFLKRLVAGGKPNKTYRTKESLIG